MIDKLIDLLSSGPGLAASNTVSAVAIIAALSPAVVWMTEHRADDIACLTYGQVMVIGIAYAGAILMARFTQSDR